MNFLHKLVRPAATKEQQIASINQNIAQLQQQIESTNQKIAQLQQQRLILEQQHTPAEDASAVLPPGWQIIMEHNKKFYYHKSTGKLQTQIPTLPPPPPPPKPIMSPDWEVLTVGKTTWYRQRYTGDLKLEFPEASAYDIRVMEEKRKEQDDLDWLRSGSSRGGTKNKRKQSKRKNK